MVYVYIISSLFLETLEVLFLTTGSRHSWTPTHQLLQQVPVCLFLLVTMTTLLCSSPPFLRLRRGQPHSQLQETIVAGPFLANLHINSLT